MSYESKGNNTDIFIWMPASLANSDFAMNYDTTRWVNYGVCLYSCVFPFRYILVLQIHRSWYGEIYRIPACIHVYGWGDFVHRQCVFYSLGHNFRRCVICVSLSCVKYTSSEGIHRVIVVYFDSLQNGIRNYIMLVIAVYLWIFSYNTPVWIVLFASAVA